MDIYIAIVVSGIFLLQLHSKLASAYRRQKILEAINPLLDGVVSGLQMGLDKLEELKAQQKTDTGASAETHKETEQ